jgi:hypothetical protein
MASIPLFVKYMGTATIYHASSFLKSTCQVFLSKLLGRRSLLPGRKQTRFLERLLHHEELSFFLIMSWETQQR